MEVLLGIIIFSTVIVSLFSLVFMIIYQSQYIIDRFQATYLAQEGIEVVRALRDECWENNDVFDCFLEEGEEYYFVINSGEVEFKELNNNNNLKDVCLNNDVYINSSSCGSGDFGLPKFTREINIFYVDDNLDISTDPTDILKVEVEVKINNTPMGITLKTFITDWKQI